MKTRFPTKKSPPNFRPDYHFETEFGQAGPVIGIDEAGRGPWAGPVSAAAFWICPDTRHLLPEALTDSKKLSARQRNIIEAHLLAPQNGHLFAVEHVSVADIDRLGILNATFQAMQMVANQLARQLTDSGFEKAPIALIDGHLTPEMDFQCHALIKGDSRSLSIAAASVLAKQARDRLMDDLAKDFPVYGWQSNAGYGTKAHQQALAEHGISPHHRRSFAPIKKLL